MHLLINADDFGISESVNKAINYCFNNNIIQRTTLMVNMDGTDSAVDLSQKNGYADKVGLHLNLIEGAPLTEPIKKTVFCTNGVFNGQAMRKQRNRFILDSQTQNAVEIEIRAQIEKYIGYGFTLLHIDSHQHTHTNPSIFKLLLPLINEYGFLSLRLSRNIPENEIAGIKKIYKNAFNKKVRRFNRCHQYAQWFADFFGAQADVDKIAAAAKYQSSRIEVEVHPIIGTDGRLKDLLHPVGVDEWIKKYK